MLKHFSDKIAGLLVSCIALVYFTKSFSATHRFSYVRLCYVLLLTTMLFSPIIVFVAIEVGEGETLARSWGGIAVASLMCGAVGSIFSLGLACSKKQGALSRFLSKVLQCHMRESERLLEK